MSRCRCSLPLLPASLAVVVLFSPACPAPPVITLERARPAKRPTVSAGEQRIIEIQRLLMAAKVKGGSPTLKAVLGKHWDAINKLDPCPEHLTTSLPVWISPHHLPGSAKPRPPHTVLFFVTPYGSAPSKPPTKKIGGAEGDTILLCALSLHPSTGKINLRGFGGTFGAGKAAVKWLEFPPGHALIEVRRSYESTSNGNETVQNKQTVLIGFPKGRVEGLGEILVEDITEDGMRTLTSGTYDLVRAGKRYFLVTANLTSEQSAPNYHLDARPPEAWTLSYSIEEIDPGTQVVTVLKGAPLRQALALPQLKEYVTSKGRGSPPEL